VNYSLRKDDRHVSEDDIRQYKSIFNLTSAHLEGYEPNAPIHVSRGIKFKTIIAKLFPRQKVVALKLHCAEWETYMRC
jgi:hypothetical protein